MVRPSPGPGVSPVEFWIPGLAAARGYRREWLRDDLSAGLVLSAMLVPQGMAYAQLAGLPPVTGLYTTVISLLAYAVFGPSRILVLGPDSALGPLIAAAILPLVGAGGDPARAVALAGLLALIMGVMCIGAGLAGLGTLAELLSKPIRVGYLNGIAIVVIVSQIPAFFGFTVDAASTPGELWAFLGQLVAGSTNPIALAIGLASLGVILGFRAWMPRVPGVLMAVVGSTLAVALLGLAERGLALVGPVPSGFPVPSLPSMNLADAGALVLAGAGLAFVTLADTSALSRAFATRAGDEVDPNQEIVALGVANVSVAFFQGFPVSASSSRTAVAKTAGAHSQLVGVVGAITMAVLLLAGGELTTSLPSACLAAIVVAAGFALFDLPEMYWLWRVRRSEFWLCASALLGVVVVGVLEGIVIAIALSLANFVRRALRPHDAELGRLATTKGYHDTARHPEAALVPGLVVYRFDAPIFFANAEHFARRVKALVASRSEPVRWVVVAAEPVTDIDTTGAEMLVDLLADLARMEVELAFAELKGPVKDRLRRYGIFDQIGEDRVFPTLGTAVDGYLHASRVTWHDPLGD
jgi:high affinity sulfate transporter 1